MAIFCYKKINDTALRLGTIFKKAREKRGLSTEAVADLTHLPIKYITYLEQGNFYKLPKAKGYRLAYARSLAEALELNAAEVLNQFEQEAGLAGVFTTTPRERTVNFPFSSISIFIRNTVGVLFVVVVAGYLFWHVQGTFHPPKLTLFSPTEGLIANQSYTLVEGETEPESKLDVNGQDVVVNDQGRFEIKIDLSSGLNTITITATKKKHGKSMTITRHVIVRGGVTHEPLSRERAQEQAL